MIKRFNEIVGFDDEDLKNKFEIPNLRGEFDPGSSSLRTYSKKSDDKNTETELNKILYKFPILTKFFTDEKMIEGSKLVSFYATSREIIDGFDYYLQLSFAYNLDSYFVGYVARERQNYEFTDEWEVENHMFETIEEVYTVVLKFIQMCKDYGVIIDSDFSEISTQYN